MNPFVRTLATSTRQLRRIVRSGAFSVRDRCETDGHGWQTSVPPLSVGVRSEGAAWPGFSTAARPFWKASRIAVSVRQRTLALRLASVSVRLAPDDPNGWLQLSRALRSSGPAGPVPDDVRGLVMEPTGRPVEAIAAASRAVRIAPSSADGWIELGLGAHASGDEDTARDALRRAVDLDPDSADAWLRSGRVVAEVAARRGGFSSSDFSFHRSALSNALVLDPGNRLALYHLCRVAIRDQDWVTAIDAADPSGRAERCRLRAWILSDDHRSAADAVRALAGNADLADDPALTDAWLVAYWRLVSVGETTAGFDAKDAHARGVVAQHHDSTALDAVIARTRAHVSLDQLGEAGSIVAERMSATTDRRHVDILGKLAHDIRVLSGRVPGGFVGALDELPSSHRRREECFDEMIRGRSVVIVGPLADHDEDDRIADADVVLSTLSTGVAAESSASRQASNDQRRIAYVANSSLARFSDRLRRMLDVGAFDLLVARPTALPIAPHLLTGRDDVRFSPFENAALLEATQYAIPRMLYDVLHHSPTDVTVCNADLFASGRRYDEGYRNPVRTRAASNRSDPHVREIVENLDGYGHDLRADHRWMRRLLGHGAVHMSPHLASIVDLPEHDYLDRVGSAHRSEIRGTAASTSSTRHATERCEMPT